MSNSIFHVRPLDSGKGWAIDEYDGRGAWQHSLLPGERVDFRKVRP